MGKKVEVEKTAIVGCVHTPFQDDKAVDATLDFLKYWKPDRLILNGDIYDLYAISSHKKDPKKALLLQDEVDAGRDFNARLRKTLPDTDILFNQGNHEARWEAFVSNNAPSLLYLDDLSFESAFRLNDFKIRYNRGPNGSYASTKVGEVSVGHYPILRSDSGATAKALVNKMFGSVISHHSHRMGTYVKNTPNGRFIGQEGGCLCTLEPEWLQTPDWEQGFVIHQKLKGKDQFHIDPIRVINGKILFDGRLF